MKKTKKITAQKTNTFFKSYAVKIACNYSTSNVTMLCTPSKNAYVIPGFGVQYRGASGVRHPRAAAGQGQEPGGADAALQTLHREI